MARKGYLRRNVVIEPLVADWYAWSLLLPPSTFGLIAKNSHLRILESFLEAPSMHWEASKTPTLRGGPFLGLPPTFVAEVRELYERSKKNLRPQIELGEAIQRTWTLLKDCARGGAMESLYQQIPEVLRGCVELTYDATGHGQARLIEPLLYDVARRLDHHQSIRIWEQTSDHRPFALNTPRLPSRDAITVCTGLSSSTIDRLAAARFEPDSIAEIAEELNLDVQQRALFDTFFTAEVDHSPAEVVNPGEVRITYLNHATVLLETANCNVLLDPALSHAQKQVSDVTQSTYSHLPDRIDTIALTHNHQDHVVLESLLELRHRCRQILTPRNAVGNPLDPSMALMLRSIGFPNVATLGELEKIDIADGWIMSLPFLGEHGDLSIQSKTGYLIELKGRRLLFLADSNNLEPRLYERLRDIVPRPDMTFIGMECEGAPMSWLYGSLLPFGIQRQHDLARRLNGSDAKRAYSICDTLEPSQVVVYAMGREDWLGHLFATDYTSESTPIKEAIKLVDQLRQRRIEADFPYGRKSWILSAC